MSDTRAISSPSRTVLRLVSAFMADEDGAVLVLWAMFLAVALGFMALAFDLGRVATTQTELQSFADQVALAAAGELDGRADAITRATAAANGLIADAQTYGNGTQALGGAGDITLVFLTSLPASDTAAATATTTNGRLARYVRVTTAQRNVLTLFASANAALIGEPGTKIQSGVTAVATAGMTSYACDVTPLMFCVPDGTWRAVNNIGDQILLRSGGGGAGAWGPGNFGFLDPTVLPVDEEGPCGELSGANLYRCLVGAERAVTACIRTDAGVDTQPGQRVGLAEAFNARFDIFQGPMSSEATDPDYRPAPNTIQGTKPRGAGATCRGNNTDPSAAMPLPRDNCIISGTCGRFGDGNWNRAAYVAANHGGAYPLGTSGTSSRYQMYLAEIAAAQLRAPPNNVPLPGFDETGAPQCHSSVSPDPDRRTVIAAAIDCTSVSINGSTRNVVPLEYVKLFMTQPVQSAASDVDILVEVVNTAGGSGSGAINGIYNDFVQLYR